MESPNCKQEQPHGNCHHENSDSSSGCGCFSLFRFKPLRNNENDNDGEKRQVSRETTASWLGKVKGFPTAIVGQKWRNCIRKVGGYCKGNKKHNKTRFQYDPQSYALNFDSGLGREEEQENGPLIH